MRLGPRSGARFQAFLLAALLGGCKAAPERQSVDRMVVAETEGAQRLEALGLPRDEVRRAALQAVAASALFGPPVPEGEKARRWLGRVAVHRGDLVPSQPPLAQVLLTFELSPRGEGGTIRETARAAEPVVAPGQRGQRDALARATSAALSRAMAGFDLLLAAERKADGALILDLSSPDARVRDVAIRTLADRKNRAAVPALVERLADPDPEVVERAIGALGQIGDPAAVGPLVRLAQRRQGPAVAQLVRVIGDLGGSDARAYLLTQASGNPDPYIQHAAQQALDDLTAREAEAARGAGR
jgi:hypothetical protein